MAGFDFSTVNEIQRLRAEVRFLKEHLAQFTEPPGPLTPPPEYYIVDATNGRATSFCRNVGICSTVSHMDALRWCWMHYLGIVVPYDCDVTISWRQLESGWVWWYSNKRSNKEWIASKDFTSIKECIIAAYPQFTE